MEKLKGALGLVKCNDCRRSISETRYECIECNISALCLFCIGNGEHSQHNVVEFGRRDSLQVVNGGMNRQRPQHPRTVNTAIQSIHPYGVIPAIPAAVEPRVQIPGSSFQSNHNSRENGGIRVPISNGEHPVYPSPLPYGIIPAVPVMEEPERYEKSSTNNVQAQRPVKSGQVPAKPKEVPAKPKEVPAKSKEVPAKTKEVPAKTKEVPAKTKEVPAKSKEVPAKSKEVPTRTKVTQVSKSVPGNSFRDEDTQSIHSIDSDIPLTWTPAKRGDNYTRKLLQSSDQEYKSVIQNMSQNGGQKWIKNVASVHRIENRRLYRIFRSRLVDMDMYNDPGQQNERILYHGTSADALENIYRDGFNRAYCGKNATAYGDGVYFARSVDYSARPIYSPPDKNGQKYIFQCRVLTGHYCQGEPGLKEPPLINREFRFDSVVDDLNNPQIFVIFRDMQVYPDYLITLNV